jgi:hypothetical protein
MDCDLLTSRRLKLTKPYRGACIGAHARIIELRLSEMNSNTGDFVLQPHLVV